MTIEPELINPSKSKSSIITLGVGDGVMEGVLVIVGVIEGVLVIVGVIEGDGNKAFTSYVLLYNSKYSSYTPYG
jgi:hypothetical protein